MAQQEYTKQDVIKMLKNRQGDRTVRALAAEFNVTEVYMGDVLRGLSNPGPAILGPLGLEKDRTETIYRKVA